MLKTSPSRPRRRTLHGPCVRLHDGDAPAAIRVQHLCRPPQPGTDAGQTEEDSGRPQEYLRKQMDIPEDLDDLPEEEHDEYIEEIENAAISFDPTVLKEDIQQIGRLIDQAQVLEHREIESKLVKLKKRSE